MSVDIIPDIQISKDQQNDINKYGFHLGDSPYIKKYLDIEKWIKQIESPLEIQWVQLLLAGDQVEMNKNFLNIENSLGENNTKAIFKEITEIGTNYPEEINQKIESMRGEIKAYYQLKKIGHESVKKMDASGDWSTKSSIISVKSKQTLDSNYSLLATTLKGLMLVKQNHILRKYRDVYISGLRNMDHKFRSQVINFFRNDLVGVLASCDTMHKIDLKGIERNYSWKNRLMKICAYKDYKVGKINIYLSLNYYDNGKTSSCKLRFREMDEINSKQLVSIGFDTDGFWEVGKKLDDKIIESSVSQHLNDFEKGYVATSEFGKEFIGWINFPIYPKHQPYITENKEFISGQLAERWKSDREYKLYVCFLPQYGFELKREIVMEL